MPLDQSFIDYVLAQLNQVVPARSRKMFGGVGIFVDDLMFALITGENVLHFKVDDSNRADFEAAGMAQFQRMPYFRLPEGVLDDVEALQPWAEKSVAVARAAAANKRKK